MHLINFCIALNHTSQPAELHSLLSKPQKWFFFRIGMVCVNRPPPPICGVFPLLQQMDTSSSGNFMSFSSFSIFSTNPGFLCKMQNIILCCCNMRIFFREELSFLCLLAAHSLPWFAPEACPCRRRGGGFVWRVSALTI